MPTIFLSLRGDGAPRVLESFRRALGEEATTLVVVPTNDENGYHGSAEVTDVMAAREAFALARKPYPALKAFLGGGGQGGSEEAPRLTRSVMGESRSRGPEQASPGGRRRAGEGRPPGQERSQDKPAPTEETDRPRRRSSSRGRGRGDGRTAPGGTGEKPLA